MLRPGTFALTALLAALSAVGPLTTDLYLPSLPDIVQKLGGTAAQGQLTISAYLIGFALGQILYGPLSDRHGRKPVLVGALALYCAASLLVRAVGFAADADRRARFAGARRLRRHRAGARHRARPLLGGARRPRALAHRLGDGAGAGAGAGRRRRVADRLRLALGLRDAGDRRALRHRHRLAAAAGNLAAARRSFLARRDAQVLPHRGAQSRVPRLSRARHRQLCRAVRLDFGGLLRAAGPLPAHAVFLWRRLRARLGRLHDRRDLGRAHGRQARHRRHHRLRRAGDRARRPRHGGRGRVRPALGGLVGAADGDLSRRPRHGAAAGDRRRDDAVSGAGGGGVRAARLCAADGGGVMRRDRGLFSRAERLAARHRRRADGLRQPAAVAFDARAARRVLNAGRTDYRAASRRARGRWFWADWPRPARPAPADAARRRAHRRHWPGLRCCR